MYKSHRSILMLMEIGLFPVFGHYKQSCYKHPCICRRVNKCTTFPQVYNKVELLNRVGACLDVIDATRLFVTLQFSALAAPVNCWWSFTRTQKAGPHPWTCCIRTSVEEVQASAFLKSFTSDSPAHSW